MSIPPKHISNEIYAVLMDIKGAVGEIKGTMTGISHDLERVSLRVEQVDRDSLERHSALGQRVAVLERDKAEKRGRHAILFVIWGGVVVVAAKVIDWVLGKLPPS